MYNFNGHFKYQINKMFLEFVLLFNSSKLLKKGGRGAFLWIVQFVKYYVYEDANDNCYNDANSAGESWI
jgi:hypothetical protein